MYNRQYGSSGYRPSHHNHREEPKKKGFKFKPAKFLNKFKADGVVKWVLAIAAVLLILLWLCLGSFRFMLTRVPAFTGFIFGNRNYIVLFQNNYELRPTGGFISTYGILKFRHGIPAGIEFSDVYGDIDDHDYVEPPLVLGALLNGEGYQGHTFRDANFDPDLTISKEDLLEFYALSYPDTRIDGVIAADFTMLENLVELYEPMFVEGFELTHDNLFETLSTAVSDIDRHNEEALANRKNVTSPIVKKVIKKSVILPWRLNKFLKVVEQGFNEKHVLANFNRRRLSRAYAKRGWDGSLPNPDRGDALIINDSNYGGMKSNRYITRDVQYELEVSDARDVLGNPVVTGNLQITLSHEGIWNIPLSGPYTGYLRALIPLGSDVVQGSSVTETREDFEVLGELVELAPGESVTYNYTFVLPEHVWDDGVYTLDLHKQPGTDADHYRVIVKVPQGKSVKAEGFDVRENVAFFETNLLEDEMLSFAVLPDSNPPRIVSHELTALNEITIVFNEAVGVDHAGDPLKYQITDTNYTNGNQTDPLLIENIRVDGAAVIITTSGMSVQPEERYAVELRGLKDLSGNTIEPSPRTITVIQRENLPGAVEEENAEDDEVQADEETTTSEETVDNPEASSDNAIPAEESALTE